MNDEPIARRLKELGYPEHVWRAGRAGLIARWRAFVEEVERGYPLGLEEYRNDLDVRAIIARLGLDAEVREFDQRLERMLTARDKRVWESPSEAGAAPFWDFGYPSNAAGDLLEGLKAEGLT
ncbi:MAG TPA: hypothetical protein VGW35_18100 [Methylomirabilota bacterium]|jgi:hypothetical protein|nr:hypothetical protein [Methylomirabilota bacterium]